MKLCFTRINKLKCRLPFYLFIYTRMIFTRRRHLKSWLIVLQFQFSYLGGMLTLLKWFHSSHPLFIEKCPIKRSSHLGFPRILLSCDKVCLWNCFILPNQHEMKKRRRHPRRSKKIVVTYNYESNRNNLFKGNTLRILILWFSLIEVKDKCDLFPKRC